MSRPQAARDPFCGPSLLKARSCWRQQGSTLACVAFSACLCLSQPAGAQISAARTATEVTQSEDLLIAMVRANGVERGEFTVLRRADGDFWIQAQDLSRLKVEASDAALRTSGTDRYYSVRALGAAEVRFDEAALALSLHFPSATLEGTRIAALNGDRRGGARQSPSI